MPAFSSLLPRYCESTLSLLASCIVRDMLTGFVRFFACVCLVVPSPHFNQAWRDNDGGPKLAVLADDDDRLHVVLENMGLLPYFDFVLTSREVCFLCAVCLGQEMAGRRHGGSVTCSITIVITVLGQWLINHTIIPRTENSCKFHVGRCFHLET